MLLNKFEEGKQRLIDSLIHRSNSDKSNNEILSEISQIDKEIQFLKHKLKEIE